MIIDFMISVLVGFVRLILTPLPNVPATPQAITDGGAWIITQISSVISVLRFVLTDTLLIASVTIGISLFAMPWAYHTIMWVLRKIPVINIK